MNASIWSYVWQASLPVKAVILLLLATSLASWAMILRRQRQLAAVRQSYQQFEAEFWSNRDAAGLYQTVSTKKHPSLAEQVFIAGYAELLPLLQQQTDDSEYVISMANRAMRVVQARYFDRFGHAISWLATIGSTSPYLGLVGTVWGIINAFQSLGAVQQATIAMVAPGISEALVTTALGLVVAIPAVIAYNRMRSQLNLLDGDLARFQAEFVQLACRQTRGLA